MRAPSVLARAGALRYVRWRRFAQLRVLRMFAHLSAILRRAAESERGAPAVRAIGGGGDGWEGVSPVRQGEPKRKRAIGAKLDHTVADPDFSVRLGGAVDDRFRI